MIGKDGKEMGNDGGVMGDAQGFTRFILGLLFSRRGVKKEKLDRTRPSEKV